MENSNQPSLSEAINDFQNVLSPLASRLNINPNGELHRFKLDNERKGRLSGAYIFYTTPIFSGWWQNWVTGESGTWTFKSNNELSHDEKLALRLQVEENKAKRKAEQAERYRKAEQRALSIWSRSKPASPNHPYAQAKRMSVEGMRESRGSLIIPLVQGGKITSLQFIDANKGNKRFLGGGKITGSAFIFGDVRKPFDVAYVAESVSTGYSVHVLGDYAPTFCAMSAGNLKSVAVAVRHKFKQVKKIVIASDNDIRDNKNDINVGVVKAREAAKACGGVVAIPNLPNGKKCDWCDLRLLAMGVSHDG